MRLARRAWPRHLRSKRCSEGTPAWSTRPMERVATPLRAMGADVTTEDGHPPLTIRGAELRGIRFEPDVPSAQVKGAVLLAALAAEGTTTVAERVPTRDHTERAVRRPGGTDPIRRRPTSSSRGRSSTRDSAGVVPGDPSSAAFLLGAAALTRRGRHDHGGEPEPDPTRLRATCSGGWVSTWRSTSTGTSWESRSGAMHLRSGRRTPTGPRRRRTRCPS